ncbi:glycosyltransferase family 25 protein [Klebsiella michiganensis]|uniref:glycosyltransferase family 25 protein n=1 Tax=Klebsiella michiganensis TaxID=1134687 RepID=UPI00295FCEDF|nr:glycosyltransferase family 25 protein [Klebsiella michiganensis]
MQIYILSRKKDTKRRESIEKQLSKIKSTYSFFDAIEPEQLPDSVKANGSSLTLGERSCAYSHVKISHEIYNSQAPYSIVMEDDAEIHESLDEKAETLSRLHEFFDVIILGYSKVAFNKRRQMQFIRPVLKLKINNSAVAYPYKQWKCGTVCYSISHKGALKLKKINMEAAKTADDWDFFEKSGLIIGHYLPIFVTENYTSFGSALEEDRNTYKNRKYFLRYMAGILRHTFLPLRYIQFLKIKTSPK